MVLFLRVRITTKKIIIYVRFHEFLDFITLVFSFSAALSHLDLSFFYLWLRFRIKKFMKTNRNDVFLKSSLL